MTASQEEAGSTKGRRGRVSDHVRAAILEAATELVATRGPNVSMRELAGAAGVGRATLYRYFPTHEDLTSALLTAAKDEAGKRIREARLDQVPFEEGLARAARALVAVGSRYLVLLSEAIPRNHELDPEHDAEIKTPLRSLLQRGHEEGAIRPDVPLDWHEQVFGGLILSALRTMQDQEMGIEDAAELVTRQFLDGARAPATRP